MFQMMNEARLMVGLNGVATASVGLLRGARVRSGPTTGSPLGNKDPATPQVPIIEHADVRRMLLRQKAIVEGGLALLARCAWYCRSRRSTATSRRGHAPSGCSTCSRR